jgi:hypothetical protein
MPAPRRDREPGGDRPHTRRAPPPAHAAVRRAVRRAVRGAVRGAAEPLAWWAALTAVYLGLASTISVTEITVGAAAAAACAAAAVAGRRALLTDEPTGEPADRPTGEPAGGAAPGRRPVPLARLAGPLALLPVQITADIARITVRGAAGGDWTPLAVAPDPARRGAATLLMSASPGTYVGGVDPGRNLVRVHRLTPRPSPFERRLRAAGLIGGPVRDADGEVP